MGKASLCLLSLLAIGSAVACRSTGRADDAEVKVTNGTEGAPTPDIRLLVVQNVGVCTGTFVNPTTMLTAAHCVAPSVPGGGVEIDTGKSINYFVNPKFFPLFKAEGGQVTKPGELDEAGSRDHFQYYDLAVVIFPPDTAQKLGIRSFRAVRAGATQKGESVFVVGFGDNDFEKKTGSGRFRFGSNVIDELGAHFFTTRGLLAADGSPVGTNANPAHGDSGAPLVAQNQDVIGTVSSGGAVDGKAVAVYVNLTSDHARELFDKAINCKFPPCAQNFVGSGVTGQGNGGNDGKVFGPNGFDGRQPDQTVAAPSVPSAAAGAAPSVPAAPGTPPAAAAPNVPPAAATEPSAPPAAAGMADPDPAY
jgi:hypothetical protein